jgi:hypothetical protein
MSSAEERYTPGASSSYSQDEFCEVCNEVTCECCRRSVITPCCDNIVCVHCVLKSVYRCCKSCNEYLIDCKICEKKCSISKTIIVRYLRHLKVSETDFNEKIRILKKN